MALSVHTMAISLDLVLRTLQKHHAPPRTFLEWRTPLDLLVATILSAQCTDSRVNAVTKTILYPKYHRAEDYAQASQEELERDIHSCGTFRMKAKHIRAMCTLLLQQHSGNVPQSMEELIMLPGVGRKTASVVLWAAFGKNEGIAVDTHVLRVARRLGLSQGKTPQIVERDLQRALPRKRWGEVTTLLISHGRSICKARRRLCDLCPFHDACPSSFMRNRADITCSDERTGKQ